MGRPPALRAPAGGARVWLALLALVAGCDRGGAPVRRAAAGAAPIPCALDHAAALAPGCTVERLAGGRLVLRHPDGGFRTLLITADGRGVASADGAEGAVVTVAAPGAIDVAIGADRYRLPATVQRPAAAR